MSNTFSLKRFNCCSDQRKKLDANISQTEIASVYNFKLKSQAYIIPYQKYMISGVI
jgi:hypothetical protein